MNRNQNQFNDINVICEKIRQANTLKDELTISNISLPGGYAEKVAKEIKEINTSQLRKFFSIVKHAENQKNFESSRDNLFALVPQMAYSVGRKICNPGLYYLVKTCIKPTKIQTNEDISAFVKFFEYIVAYTKFEEVIKKGRN